jgi:glutamate/tyrosine decarboxylase-like PLP-dependent enzyme/SAM-dependent methyltransferase
MPSDSWTSDQAYEPYIGRWSRLVAPWFLRWLPACPGAGWCDVGCGTGALARAIVDGERPRSVLGVDPSPAYLAAARGPGLGVAVGTATALPTRDAAFDRVVSALVLNFVPRPDAALAEMRRVTRAGGWVGGYVWDYAEGMQLIRRFWDAATALDPAATELDEARRFPLCRPEPLRTLFATGGLSDVDVEEIVVRTRFADFDDLWGPFLGGQGPAPGYCVALPAERRDALRERLRGTLPTASDGSITLTARAWAVRGRVPDPGPAERGAAVLRTAAALAISYAGSVDDRRVAPGADAVTALQGFDEALPEVGVDAERTLRLLHEVGGPATVASTGARYFGFVTGGTYPVALGSAWLAGAWDQNAALPVMSPVAARLHEVVRGWLVDLLRLPADTGIAFVTGATVANACGLAAGRDALLARMGWDAQADGLFGAPVFDVVVGERAHSTLSKSLGLVGLGRSRVIVVPADDQGRMRADRLPASVGPVLVCAQAGEVNTGAFDPFDEIADWAAGREGWLHVDGAFGLWARADPGRAELVAGLDRADSWATDGHKWLNVGYDCGLALVRRLPDLRRTFTTAAGYLPSADPQGAGGFEAMHHTPQSSQRARQIELWAVLRTLGRRGVAELVDRSCAVAMAIAERLRTGGLTVLNDVVLNQVLVRLVDGPTTDALIAAVQADGRIWCGPTTWDGSAAMRISVSSWRTGLDDAAVAADVILQCAERVSR